MKYTISLGRMFSVEVQTSIYTEGHCWNEITVSRTSTSVNERLRVGAHTNRSYHNPTPSPLKRFRKIQDRMISEKEYIYD